MWHMTRDRWTFSQSFRSLALTVWKLKCFKDILTKDEWQTSILNEWHRCFKNNPGYTGSVNQPPKRGSNHFKDNFVGMKSLTMSDKLSKVWRIFPVVNTNILRGLLPVCDTIFSTIFLYSKGPFVPGRRLSNIAGYGLPWKQPVGIAIEVAFWESLATPLWIWHRLMGCGMMEYLGYTIS